MMVAASSADARPVLQPIPRDIAIVGAGAAGLATAIFARRPPPGVVVLDGAQAGRQDPGQRRRTLQRHQRVVTETDFWGGTPTIVRRVLRAFPVDDTVAFFASSASRCTRKPAASCFPTRTARATCSTRCCGAADARRRRSRRHARARRRRAHGDGFALDDLARPTRPRGRSSSPPADVAAEDRQRRRRLRDRRALGHTHRAADAGARAARARRPAPPAACTTLSRGSRIDSRAGVWIDDACRRGCSGSLLWTHFGVSGPVALEHVAALGARAARGTARRLTLNLHPGSASRTSTGAGSPRRRTGRARRSARRSPRSARVGRRAAARRARDSDRARRRSRI